MIQAGKLRHRVEHETGTTTTADSGQVTTTWTTAGTYWAQVSPASSREAYWARQQFSETTHVVTMRVGPTITTRDRLIYDGRILEIISVYVVDELGETLRLACKERPSAV